MIQSHHKKIGIIGCAGSGKTYLALKLQEKLKLPLYHLDQYYWKSGWQRTDLETFSKIHQDLCEQTEWIIEGTYYNVFVERVMSADVIIFLDIPRWRCIWQVLKRSICNHGKVIPGSAQGCKQSIFSVSYLQFLWWIWNFNKRYRALILDLLKDCKSSKQVYILRSFKEIDLILLNQIDECFNEI